MKNITTKLVLVAGGVLLCGIASLAFAQFAPTASLVINGSTGAQLPVGFPWVLSITSNVPSSAITICAINNQNVQSCTPGYGSTDKNGNGTITGTINSDSVGNWTEWAQLSANGTTITSNHITFIVYATPTQPPTVPGANPSSWSPTYGYCVSNNNCAYTDDGQVCRNANTPLSYCGLPSGTPGSKLSQIFSSALSSVDLQGCTGNPNVILADVTHCNQVFTDLAASLGYTATCVENPAYLPGSATPASYNTTCSLGGNGVLGTIPGSAYTPYDLVSTSAANDAQLWSDVLTGASTAGNTGGTGGTNNGGSNTGTGTPATSTVVATSPGGGVYVGTGAGTQTPPATTGGVNNLSSINSALNSALAGFAATLNGSVNTTPTSGAGSTQTTPTQPTSGGTSGGSCLSSASVTLSSSLETLQSLAGILSSSNVSPAVLLSVQNLLNAVGQVISALSSCIGS